MKRSVSCPGVAVSVGRKNGDPLRVGEEVRIRLLVEEDMYFGVVACGEHQCGGIRVEGVDWRGMGFRTFISNATDHPFRAKWIVRVVSTLSAHACFV